MRKGHIFIVENDPDVRDSLTVLLEAHQYEVSGHDTCDGFVRRVRRDGHVRPACLLLDLDLPAMSGRALLRTLPQLKIDLPVIVITGSDIEDVRGEVEESGAFALFEKPLADRRLLAAVERALVRRRG